MDRQNESTGRHVVIVEEPRRPNRRLTYDDPAPALAMASKDPNARYEGVDA